MIESPVISNEVWYWYVSYMYIQGYRNVYLVKLIEKSTDDFYIYEDDRGLRGGAYTKELFKDKSDAEEYFKSQYDRRINKIKSSINSPEDLLNTALRKNTSSIYSSDEIEIAVFEKAKEMNLLWISTSS